MNLLNEIRKQQNIKFRDLSAATGYSIGHLGNIFTGRLAVVTDEAKKKIARALGVPIKVVFKDEKRRKNGPIHDYRNIDHTN